MESAVIKRMATEKIQQVINVWSPKQAQHNYWGSLLNCENKWNQNNTNCIQSQWTDSLSNLFENTTLLMLNHAIIKKKTSKLTVLIMVIHLPSTEGSHFILIEGRLWKCFPLFKKKKSSFFFLRPSVWLLKSHQLHCENAYFPHACHPKGGSQSQRVHDGPGPSKGKVCCSLVLLWGILPSFPGLSILGYTDPVTHFQFPTLIPRN